MTKEEYREKTGITNIEEAQWWLKYVNILFIAVFGLLISIKVGAQYIDRRDVLEVALLVYWVLWIFFLIFCYRLIRRTKDVTKAHLLWALVFAPVSWFWFYPELVKPLKIIIGEIPPPEQLPSREERDRVRAGANKRFWKTMLVAILISVLLVGGIVIYIVSQSP